MANETTKEKAYEKLSKSEQMVIDIVLKNLEDGSGLWSPGWVSTGLPRNAITGKGYRGSNNIRLFMIGMERGYKDNRWLTFRQMTEKGWSFKQDEEGNSLAKNKGVGIDYYELRDRETKRPFDRSVLDGMTEDEKREYMDENVYALKRSYTVFNADLVEGIPANEETLPGVMESIERVDNFLDGWSEKEAKIVYGGDEAYYSPRLDEIHLPEQKAFRSTAEFYSTALHELGHSTGHEKRLNRQITNSFASDEYAKEELRAEIGSLFLEQEFGVPTDPEHLRNSCAYVENWYGAIKKDPSIFFSAVTDASKISAYVMDKEREFSLEKEATKEKSEAVSGPLSFVDSASSSPADEAQKEGETEATRGGMQGGAHPLASVPSNSVRENAQGVQGGGFPLAQDEKIEPYAIVKDEDDAGETVYRLKMIAPYGQTRSQFGGYGFRSPEALMKEFSIMQLKPVWRGTKFKEVSISELAEMSRERADQYYAKQERRNEDRKIGYMLPSQYAAKVENEWRPDMKGRGIESLAPSDRELVSKAETGTEGSVFQALFRGDRVTGEWAADVNSIMRRLALYTEDAEQIGRVFRASGQFREGMLETEIKQLATSAIGTVKKILPKIMQTDDEIKHHGSRQNSATK